MKQTKRALSVEEQFLLFEKAKELLNAKGDENKEKTSNRHIVEELIREWRLRRKFEGKEDKEEKKNAYGEPSKYEKRCGMRCMNFIETLDDELRLFVCEKCGVSHECKVDDKCRSTYVGEDRATYCCFSKAMIHEELVNTFDGKSKPNQDDDDADNGASNVQMDVDSVFEQDDDLSIQEDTSFSKNKFGNDLQSTKTIVNRSTKKKAAFTRNTILQSYDVNKNQIKISKLYRLYTTRPQYINKLVALCKEIRLERQYKAYLDDLQFQLDGINSVEIDEETGEEKSHLLGKNKKEEVLHKQSRAEFFQKCEKQWKPLFEQNVSPNNWVVPHCGEITAFVSKRHAHKMSDVGLDYMRAIIKDLIFNQNTRQAINDYHLQNIRETAKTMVKRYYKLCLQRKRRPVLHHADNIYDHQIDNVKHLIVYDYNENIVNFLCAVILDFWFLSLSTPRYAQKSSDFDIGKHTLAMLYLMRKDFKLELWASQTTEKAIFTVLPKHDFLCQMLPSKRDLSRFKNSTHKKRFITADIKTGQSILFAAIKSIENQDIKRQVFEEIRDRFAKHRKYFIFPLESNNKAIENKNSSITWEEDVQDSVFV
jgi:hypothetical protein